MKLPLNINLIREYFLKRCEQTLPVRVIKQPLDQVCWAACYRMVNLWTHPDWSDGWCSDTRCDRDSGCRVPNASCNAPRLTSQVLSDWNALGYTNTTHVPSSLGLNDVRQSIREKRPLMVFLEYRNQRIGHYVLIVGTGRLKFTSDNTFVIADPLNDRLIEIGVSELSLGLGGIWQQTWSVSA